MIDDIFDFKEELGKTLQQVRKQKGLTQQDLADTYLSRAQISNIEKGKQATSFEKIIYFLDKLNLNYDEFLYHLNDDYHSSKERILEEIAKFANAGDIKTLERLRKQSLSLYNEYKIPYFLFLQCMADARIILIKYNENYEQARNVLGPIKDYLLSLKSYNYTDFSFIGECLYVFDIETSKYLVDKAILAIYENYEFYRHKRIGGAITLNMAIYSLEFPDKLHYALDYSLKSMELSTTSANLSTTLKAKIAYQVACYKIGNGRYNKNVIADCLQSFKIADWHGQYNQIVHFLKKHEIEL